MLKIKCVIEVKEKPQLYGGGLSSIHY